MLWVDPFFATDAALAHATGTQGVSASAVEMYADLDKGDQAYADLDAIDASIQMSGGAGEAALVAWGVFSAAADAYTGGL
jgi:hypothetical protein